MELGPWFEFAPGSEQEVVALFGFLLPKLQRRFLINEVRQAFPDCEAWEIAENGERKRVRIEFELRASNFVAHGHDPDGCDLIVCWEDDLGHFKVDRLELRTVIASLDPSIIKSPDLVKYPLQAWTKRTFLEKSPLEQKSKHQDILDWAGQFSPHGRVAFSQETQSPSWSFAVSLANGKKITLFGLWPDGTVWVQPRGLPGALGDLYRTHLVKAVNELDLGKQWFLRKNGIQDAQFLDVLKESVTAIVNDVI